MKNKTTAGIFALFFGPLGIHRFYLGERQLGRFYAFATVLLFMASIRAKVPIVMIMGVVSFIDAIILLSMNREEFNEKYNQRYLNRPAQEAAAAPNRHRRSSATASEVPNPWKTAGIEKFKDFDYSGAIEDFKQSLAIKFEDPAVHFNLACCYSLNERPDPAFFHLTKAVHFGFVDFDKIDKHEGLAFLRTQPEFSDFVKKGYQLHPAPSAKQPRESPDLLAQKPTHRPNLIDQIKRLSHLREQGILTEEEYNEMKEEVLRG
ncbi:MAG: TM2 domain-containing protein [Saprospiraceae bacterium]|nr:TM2 domain-containing protein [Saprospiraceae bacterium]MCF8252453.1 TM2 domain-containing protein [Saprospiraceae bacterium]MCF8282320.1 TM2 domain-containing protein [Bacteroidales bacterium]MCF8314060.1 TM2 domain-containing protein [Saprospiraceae bacterium]MCF8442798.1 TM2 domain-containing protein [Saprospiraceae bacterium]